MKSFNFFLISVLLILLVDNLLAQDNCSKTIKVCPDTIVGYKQYTKDTTGLKRQIRDLQQLTTETHELPVKNEIDYILNINDISIFTSGFKCIPLEEIHPRSRDYYSLIKNIHDLRDLLTSIDGKSIVQLSQIKTDLAQVRLLIDTINSFATTDKRKVADFLTEPQKQFYRSLVDHYNEIYKQILPNE